MKKSLIVLALVAGCGASGQSQGGGNTSDAVSGGETAAAAGGGLAGLYESAAGARPSQMCILEKGGKAQFGVTIWGANLRACSGAGTATLAGERLTLRMTGDSACTLDATLRNGIVTFPASAPAGCAYYCGAGAGFAGATLTRRGAGAAAAMKAKDVAGEALCG
jgi:hypothetical protein